MGKIDDMRRHREALFAQRQGKAAAPANDAAAEPAAEEAPGEAAEPAAAPRRRSRLGAGRSAPSEEGACSVCGKVRPVHAGVVAVHQKGLGSVCPGSRKPAA
jgi:hypothetical protein